MPLPLFFAEIFKIRPFKSRVQEMVVSFVIETAELCTEIRMNKGSSFFKE
jgi:hypothetical protein